MKLHYPILALSAVALATITSCSPDATISARISQFEKKIDAQNTAIAQFERSTSEALDKKVNTMATMAQFLAEYVTKLESDVRGEKTATLDPASKGYSSVSTDKGVFLFSVDGAESFLDGHNLDFSPVLLTGAEEVILGVEKLTRLRRMARLRTL